LKKEKAVALSVVALVVSLLLFQALPGAAARSRASAPNPYAGSTLYVGHDPGIRITIRVRGRRVILLNTLVRLNCVGPRGRHHYGRVERRFAEASSPLTIDRSGRFLEPPDRDEEPGLLIEEGVAGQVGPSFVTGSVFYFVYEEYRDLRMCQTGDRLPHFGVKPSRVRFRAERRQGEGRASVGNR
jgi:hypothetical protein